MPVSSRETLLRRRDELLAKLHAWPNLMRGSMYERTRKCGRSSCRCATEGERHVSRQLSVKVGEKMYARYVRDDAKEEVERLTKNYRELMDVIDELTRVNLDLLLRGENPGGVAAKRKKR